LVLLENQLTYVTQEPNFLVSSVVLSSVLPQLTHISSRCLNEQRFSYSILHNDKTQIKKKNLNKTKTQNPKTINKHVTKISCTYKVVDRNTL